MPPWIALTLCLVFIVYLYVSGLKRGSVVTWGLWIPLFWLLIVGSRPVSLWLNLGASFESPEDYLEGSPVDRVVFAMLIVAGLVVLLRRKVDWSRIFRTNSWVFLFFLYCGISVTWSDFPFVSLKRWIKGIGDLVMVLVILTELDPIEAVRLVVRRWAYTLIPLSVVLIKYFPELSRSYDKWTGKAFYSGVAFGKNSLGCLCLVSGLFFVWNLMTMWRRNDIGSRKKEVALDVLFVSMIWWLMGKAQSSTSWAAFCFGSFLLCALGVAFVKRSQGKFDLHVLVAIGAILMTSLFLDVQETVLGVLNRDVTLTGRTELWEELVGMVTDPVLGVGFHSFWLGERLKRLQEMYWWQPNEAHNGYLEIYLNLGAMGIVLFITLVIAAYRNCRKALVEGLESGRIRMVLLGVGLLYGVTEAAFRELSLMWFMFLLASVEWPAVVSSRGAAGSDSSMNNVWYKE